MPDKNDLRTWLAAGETERVVDALLEIAQEKNNPYFSTQVENAAGRFNSVKKDWVDGKIDDQFYYLQQAKIRPSIQNLIDKIPDDLGQVTMPKKPGSRSNAIEIDPKVGEQSSVKLDSSPAHATGKSPTQKNQNSAGPSSDEIKNPCIYSLEQKLRTMADHYFDENDFERPSAPGVFYFRSYLTLQSLKLQEIGNALRSLSVDNHNFFKPVRELARELKSRCSQLDELFEKSECGTSPLRNSLQDTVLQLELLEDALPDLITDRRTEARSALKSDYLIPLADQTSILSETMAGFDGRNITAKFN